MKEHDLEEMLVKSIKSDAKARPGRWFSFRMRMRLRRKSRQMYWREAFSGKGKYTYAGAGALLLVLTMGGGMGAYAYTSPEVNVMHPLYPIKQGLESTEVYLAPTPRVKAEIQLRHARMRTEEMRKIGEAMEGEGAASAEESMRMTMHMVRLQMNDSLVYAADQDSVKEARAMMILMHRDLEEMDAALGGMTAAVALRERQAVKAHMEDLRHYTRLKITRIDQASRQMSSPMRIKSPRVIMKCLTDQGAGLGETSADGALPADGGVPADGALPADGGVVDGEAYQGELPAQDGLIQPRMRLRFN